ncbi:MAG: VWA domain-containing protein [Trueperaceae bacterium]|nr:VWA domain-containing protein [Trueperaceae bacterium]
MTEETDPATLVLMDVSASMGAGSTGEANLQKARERLLDAVGNGGTWTVVAVGAEPTPLAMSFSDWRDVRDRLDTALSAPYAQRSDWDAASALAARRLKSDQETRVWVLTDDADAAREALAAHDMDAAYTSFDGHDSNLGIARFEARPAAGPEGPRNAAEPQADGQPWNVTVSVDARGDVPEESALAFAFQPEGTGSFLDWERRTVRLDDDGVTTIEAELRLPGPGLLRSRLVPPDDGVGLPGWNSDDEAIARLHHDPPQRRLLVVGTPEPSFARALEALQDTNLRRSETLPADLDGVDAVLALRPLDRMPSVPTWFAGTAPPDSEGQRVVDRITAWEPVHALTRPVAWHDLGEFEGEAVAQLEGAQTLVHGGRGPVLQVRHGGTSGRQLVTSFAGSALEGPSSAALPAFTAAVLDWLAPPTESFTACTVGVACVLDRPGETVVDPTGIPLRIPGSTEAFAPEPPAFVPVRAGVHTVSAEGTSERFVPVLSGTHLETLPASDVVDDAPAIASAAAPSTWLWSMAAVVVAVEALLAYAAWRRHRAQTGQRVPPGQRMRGAWIASLTVLALAGTVLALVDAPLPGPLDERYLVRVTGNDGDIAGDAGTTDDGARVVNLPADTFAPPGVNDVPEALRFAAAAVPPHRSGAIVLEDASPPTTGRVLVASASSASTAAPLPVFFRQPAIPDSADVAVQRLLAPSRVRAGAPAQLTAHVWSRQATTATLRLEREGEVAMERTIDLPDGRSMVTVPVYEEETGGVTYHLRLVAEEDVNAANNVAASTVNVSAAPRIRIVTTLPESGATLADALELQGIDTTVTPPHRTPFDAAEWQAWDGVILLNLPAGALQPDQRIAIETFVQDQGGGALMLGGRTSFGPGGYYETALDRVSPLSSRIERDAPEVSIVFVLDRSGSMQQTVGDGSRLALAKDATLSAISLLGEESLAGIVAFDAEAAVVSPLRRVENLEAIRASLAPLTPGGGTAIYPGVELGMELLQQSDSAARHMVVLSDGLSQPGPFDDLLARAANDDITVSTVAIGRGADTSRLARLAEMGSGTAHASSDFRALPGILAQEALLLSQSPVHDEPFEPRWADREASFLEGWPDPPPTLGGYVETTAKDEANVHLRGPDDAPVLASWRHGLGHVVAFTSEAVGPWATQWQARGAYPRWWTQASRWTTRASSPTPLDARVERHGDRLRVTLVARDAQASGGLQDPVVNVAGPGQSQAAPMHRTAPGEYQADVLAPPGDYQLAFSDRGERLGTSARYVVASLAAPASFDRTSPLLTAVADATGGRRLAEGETPTVPALGDTTWRWSPSVIPWALLALAALLSALAERYAPRWWARPFRRPTFPTTRATRSATRSGRPQHRS